MMRDLREDSIDPAAGGVYGTSAIGQAFDAVRYARGASRAFLERFWKDDRAACHVLNQLGAGEATATACDCAGHQQRLLCPGRRAIAPRTVYACVLTRGLRNVKATS
jgi:hypothetical protein